jgi:RNA-binding protein YhbY
MKKIMTTQELYQKNIIAVKVEKQKREYTPTIGKQMIVKEINRTSYLKICWMCGRVYETYRRSSYACQSRCSNNIVRYRKQNLNPPANMEKLTKEKYTKDIIEQFGYR